MKTATIAEGTSINFDGQGLFYWDDEMALDKKHVAKRAQLVPIVRVTTPNASIFLTVRYRRTRRTVASIRVSHADGWFRYSVLPAYYVQVSNEHYDKVVVEFNPFKGIELVTTPDCHQEHYIWGSIYFCFGRWNRLIFLEERNSAAANTGSITNCKYAESSTAVVGHPCHWPLACVLAMLNQAPILAI